MGGDADEGGVVSTRRVAVTGLGAVTPVGNDAASTWEALVAGRSGVGPITTFDAETFPVKIAGTVKGFELSHRLAGHRELARRLSRAGAFGISAALEAIDDAHFASDDYEPTERGISMGAGVGRPDLNELVEWSQTIKTSDGHVLARQAPSSVLLRNQNVPVKSMALLGDFEGPTVAVSTACSASAHAIGEAFRHIQEGDAKLMLAGGYDALTTWFDVIGFGLLGALTKDHADEPERASRPFDGERSGFVVGEGAVVAVLEDLESARARGAHIYAELAGYGSSMNAYRMTDPPPDGGGVTLSMQNTIDDAGIEPSEIDYVVAHGTSTPGNDSCETTAIKQVFGDHAYKLAISSPKSMTGHLTCAAGALNLLVGARAIQDGIVPPTINYEHPDPKLDLDYVPNEARRMDVGTVLVNSFAFGGTNACLLLRRAGGDR
jgi:3-oxoacyl-[acyl-carrier-protein] synthase II